MNVYIVHHEEHYGPGSGVLSVWLSPDLARSATVTRTPSGRRSIAYDSHSEICCSVIEMEVEDPGPPRGPDTTRDPRNPRKPAAADDPRLDGWNARTIREEFYEDGQRIMPTDKRAAPAEGHDVERVIDIWVKWKRGIDPRTFPEYLRAAIKEASDG